MVEDIEERRLGPLALKALDIIHYEDIYLFIVAEEIRQFIAHVHGVHKLGLEIVAVDVEHDQVREFLVDRNSYGLGQMGLAEAGAAENHQRVEGILSGGGGNCAAGGKSHLVALAYYEIGKAVNGIQVGVDLDFGQARIHEGARIAGRLYVHADFAVHRRSPGCCGHGHSRLAFHYLYKINQLGVGSDDALESLLDHIKVCSFEILAEEIGRDFYRERRIHYGDRPHRLEPGRELLRLYDLLHNPEEMAPNTDMSVVLVHRKSRLPVKVNRDCKCG